MLRNPMPMTPEGFKKLQDELRRLKGVERPKIVQEIETARGYGDLSENAEYHAAKEKQALLSKKIVEVEDKLARAQVIDPRAMDQARVVFGATVRLRDADSGEEETYQIVGGDEADVRSRKISIESPLAKSLIGKEVDDAVQVQTPRGPREFEILEIRYQ